MFLKKLHTYLLSMYVVFGAREKSSLDSCYCRRFLLVYFMKVVHEMYLAFLPFLETERKVSQKEIILKLFMVIARDEGLLDRQKNVKMLLTIIS